MARVFTKPKRICEVLTCKSKWSKGNWHDLINKLYENTPNEIFECLPRNITYHKHCLLGAVRCNVPISEFHCSASLDVFLIRQRDEKNAAILKTINKLAEKGKLPKRRYNSVVGFNDHPATQWKHIQLLMRHLPKDV